MILLKNLRDMNSTISRTLLLALPLLLAFGCSGSGNSDLQKEPMTDILTLELSFGDEDESSSEYLIASPFSVQVNDNDDIIVYDEFSLKVYDKNGQPIKIVGSKGQGPGEFDMAWFTHMSPAGLITVYGSSEINLLSKDIEFIEKKNFSQSDLYQQIKKDNEYLTVRLDRMAMLNDDKRVLEFRASTKEYGSPTGGQQLLLFEDAGNVNNIYRFILKFNPSKRLVSGNSRLNVGFPFDFYGRLLWGLNSNGKLVYIDTSDENVTDNDNAEYTINVNSLKTQSIQTQSTRFDEIKITKKYERALIDDKFKMKSTNFGEQFQDFQPLIDYVQEINELIDEKKYQPPIRAIRTDGKFIFAFTFKVNDKEETLTDIFDADTGEFVNSAYFHKIPSLIKNGYAYYTLSGDEETLPRIEKHKIDPMVYVK